MTIGVACEIPGGLIFVGVAVVATALLIGWQARRGRAAGVSVFRAAEAVVEVARDEQESEALCKQALHEVAGTMTSYSFKNGRLNVRSHLEGEPAGAQSLEFRVEPIGASRTRIRVKADAYPYNARYAAKRAALVEHLAAWLNQHGGSSQSMA